MKWGRFGIAIFAALTMVGATTVPAFAAAPPNGTGRVGSCTVTGSIQFKPALVNGGTQPTTIKIKLKSAKGNLCTGGTGDGLNVATVQVTGTGSMPSNDCNNLFSGSLSNTPVAMPVTAKWKMTKAATPAKISNSLAGLSSLQTAAFAPVIPTVPHFEIGFAGATVVSGSFAGDNASFQSILDQTTTDVTNACAAKGVKKVTTGLKTNAADAFKGFAVFGAS